MSEGSRVVTALFEVSLQRKLLVTRPLQQDIPNPKFSLKHEGLGVEVSLLLDELPRQESPDNGIAICQVSTIEIRVARCESSGLPFIVPIPEEPGPEMHAWIEAQSARTDECTSAALVVLNRLIAFFKYGLRNALLEPFALMDLHGTEKWLDESGHVIETSLMTLKAAWRFAPLEQTLLPERDDHLQYCLENDVKPSLVEEILLDAMGAFEERNLRHAVIEAAVCAEVATRDAFTCRYLDEREVEMAVPDLLGKVAKAVSGSSFDIFSPNDYHNIKMLFLARNKGAHEGKAYYKDAAGSERAVTRQMVAEWIRSVEILMFWLDCRLG